MFRPTFRLNRAATAGTLAVGMTIAISSFSAVRAEHTKPPKSRTFSCSSGTACLEGKSSGSTSIAVYGVSAGNTGVLGKTSATNGNSGTSGISTGTTGSGNGVYGYSSNGPGVYGASSSSNGIYGDSGAGDGIQGGSSAEGFSGVKGIQLETGPSNGGDGVDAESADTSGVFQALGAFALSSQTWIFDGVNLANGEHCSIDPSADLDCTGTVNAKAVRTRHINSSGQHVLAYASESASATLDDVGTARMVDGVANVALDRSFLSTIDPSSGYHVFLTPMGDTRGLYVKVKTPSAFEVREAQGGRSTLAFDYRIVARPLDAKNDRLPIEPAARKMPKRTMP